MDQHKAILTEVDAQPMLLDFTFLEPLLKEIEAQLMLLDVSSQFEDD